ncbi:MAG: type II toxin-antitoxin system RelE/ParE family toxin [Oscillospiraceae bacterium]|nr:type II toxin-antitoxin system RelE/ParE family toxin [Oscillospiraceae bacterium]
MTREFVRLTEFDKQCKQLGFNESDIAKIESELIVDPTKGSVISSGTGGIRKLRIQLPNRGKSGGARVIYIDFVVFEKVYLLTAYGKGKKDDLTSNEKNELKAIVKLLEDELRRRGGK